VVDVFLCISQSTYSKVETQVAVKFWLPVGLDGNLVTLRSDNYPEVSRVFKREAAIWASLHHPNILPLIASVRDERLFGPFDGFESPVRSTALSKAYLISLSGVPTEAQRIILRKNGAISTQMTD
jgi:hypothetical protein